MGDDEIVCKYSPGKSFKLVPKRSSLENTLEKHINSNEHVENSS